MNIFTGYFFEKRDTFQENSEEPFLETMTPFNGRGASDEKNDITCFIADKKQNTFSLRYFIGKSYIFFKNVTKLFLKGTDIFLVKESIPQKKESNFFYR